MTTDSGRHGIDRRAVIAKHREGRVLTDVTTLHAHLHEEFQRAIENAQEDLLEALRPMHVFTRTVILETLRYEAMRLQECEGDQDLDEWVIEKWQKLGRPLGSIPSRDP